jgi:hypothetical protein
VTTAGRFWVTADNYYASQDLEDFVTVVDGRENIVVDVDQAPVEMRRFLIDAARTLTSTAEFDEALPGQLPPDSASQQRLPKLRKKFREIAAL